MAAHFMLNSSHFIAVDIDPSSRFSFPAYSEKLPALSWALALMFAAASWLWAHRWIQRASKDPKTWPFIGSQFEASKNYDRLLDWTSEFFSHDHRTVKMSFLCRRSFLTVDPANVEYILKTNFHNFPKGAESHKRLYDMLGSGILNTDGKTWKTHRKITSAEFSVKKLKALSTTTYRKGALKLVELLETSVKTNRTVDIQDLLLRMTFDSICKVVFGGEMDSVSSTSRDDSVAAALDNAQEMLTRRYVFPWWRLQRYFDMGSERLLKQYVKRLNSFFYKVIEERKTEMNTTSKYQEKQDLLSRFMLHVSGEMETYSDDELRDASLNLIMAGRDTTASTLSWFLYCMCKHPEKADRIFEETRRLEKASEARNFTEFADLLTYESLQSMHYLHAALTETLRLYPAVPLDGKVAMSDDVLPDGTRLKGGDQVAYAPYSMGRMEFLWGKDAREFKPERWLQDGNFQPESPFKFTAFQAGPRMCLGKDAAYLQMKITAAMLMRFFRFELVAGHPVHYRMMAVMTMKYGLKVNVKPR